MIEYYLLLFALIASCFAIHYGIELRRKSKAVKDHTNCSYCGQLLHTSFRMSYGWPGIPRVYKCKRWWCDLGKYLGYLEPKNYNKEEN
jgi:hypothetical protein